MKPIAVGNWSEWTEGLRGRLLLVNGRSMATPENVETLVFVDLENRVGSGRLFDIYFDPENLKCELHDARGEEVPKYRITDGERRQFERNRPTSCWVALPDASAGTWRCTQHS
jgi:hypothetical protein